MEEAAKEAFGQIMKMALLFFGIAVFYIWLENKIFKSKKRNRKK